MKFAALWVICVTMLTGLARAVPTLNLPSSLADTKAKLAAGEQANIVVLGDSLSFREGSYLPYFRTRMQNYYGDAGPGYQGFSLWTGGGLDPGWTFGQINGDPTPHQSLDGLWAKTTNATTGGITTWARDVQIHYVAEPGGGSFAPFYWNNGQQVFLAPAIDSNNPTQQVKTFNFHMPDGLNGMAFQTFGNGTVNILGENNVKSSPGVRIHRAANGGWGVQNFLQRDWTFDDQLQLLDTDLVMVWLGQNDQGYSQLEYESKLQELVGRLDSTVPDAEVVLISTYNQGSPELPKLALAMQNVAALDGVGFINILDVGGPATGYWNHGYLDPDGIHLAPAGGAYLGNLLFDAFRTDGLSPRWAGSTRLPFDPRLGTVVVPEPSAGIVLLTLLSLRRRRRARE